MTLVALIADGGPEAGLGHLSRSSSLALALREQGASVRTLGLGLQVPIERYGVRWEAVGDPDPRGADVIVLDSYLATGALRASLGSSAPLVAFVDDQRPAAEVALIVRSGARGGRVGELAGLNYACLGPEYRSVPPRRLRPEVERVLVATGAGDQNGIGAALARELRRIVPDGGVSLVRGPYAPPTDIAPGVQIVSAPEGLFSMLVEADIVVSAAGQTVLEALAVGAPCVVVVTAENQRRQAAELEEVGGITVAATVEQVAVAVGALAGDLSARRRQARVGRRLVDGQGAMRVAAAVLELAVPPAGA
jgi:UDP-2,4-diacetamido-2,4,6-trideoxy-beta-L-altropyranose hydrolase